MPNDGKLAIVGEYVPSFALASNAAFLQTMNPDSLGDNLDQDVQTILGGGTGPTSPSFKYNAVVYHAPKKHLLAVGSSRTFYLSPGWKWEAMVSQLMEKPLFSDGFEGN